mgnify:CR=1 FL=1
MAASELGVSKGAPLEMRNAGLRQSVSRAATPRLEQDIQQLAASVMGFVQASGPHEQLPTCLEAVVQLRKLLELPEQALFMSARNERSKRGDPFDPGSVPSPGAEGGSVEEAGSTLDGRPHAPAHARRRRRPGLVRRRRRRRVLVLVYPRRRLERRLAP